MENTMYLIRNSSKFENTTSNRSPLKLNSSATDHWNMEITFTVSSDHTAKKYKTLCSSCYIYIIYLYNTNII